MNTAILLAGGSGSRMSSSTPKQYMSLSGWLMLTWAIAPLLESVCIDSVYIVAEESRQEEILEDIARAGLSTDKLKGFASPGKNRQLSIRNALIMLISDMGIADDSEDIPDEDTVFVHDAARPFLSEKQIKDCYAALPGHDGVMPALPVKDTVYQSDDGKKIGMLLDRSKVYSGQTPELFVLDKYYRANMSLDDEEIMKINGSSEPAVRAGMDIAMIPGDENNFKVTTDADMEKCRMIMEKRMQGK